MSDQVEWPPRDWPRAWAVEHGFTANQLPQHVASLTAAPEPWPAPRREGARPNSAVALLFIPASEPAAPARLVFTRRSLLVGSHKGQVAFPGGRADPEDHSPAATALRELEEELGVPRTAVKPLATLRPLTALDGSKVVPVLAAGLLSPDELRPSADEVAYAFVAPWPNFKHGMSQPFRFNIFGKWRSSERYEAGSESIWGLTAAVLRDASFS